MDGANFNETRARFIETGQEECLSRRGTRSPGAERVANGCEITFVIWQDQERSNGIVSWEPIFRRGPFGHWAVPDDLDLARQLGAIPCSPSQPVFADALAQLLSDLHS